MLEKPTDVALANNAAYQSVKVVNGSYDINNRICQKNTDWTKMMILKISHDPL